MTAEDEVEEFFLQNSELPCSNENMQNEETFARELTKENKLLIEERIALYSTGNPKLLKEFKIKAKEVKKGS